MSEIHTIAMIGSTGKAGQYIIKELINRGFKVKALLRNPEKLTIENPLLMKIKGDVRDIGDVYKLIEGCDALLSALGQPRHENPVFSEATRNIIEAMKEFRLKRYIALTGLIIDAPTDKKRFRTNLLSLLMRISFPSIIKDKQLEYYLLRESDLNWTLFRLPMIELSEPKGDVNVCFTDCKGKKISATDLAKYIADHLSDDKLFRQAPFLANI